MAHGTNPEGVHAEVGVRGIGAQYLDKGARAMAHWMVRQRWFLRAASTLDGIDPGAIGHLLRLIFGGFNLPIGGRFGAWVNIASDKLASELAEIFETEPELLRSVKEEKRLSRTKDAVVQEAREALQKQVFYVALRIAHASRTCLSLVEYEQQMTPPQKGDKKPQSRAAILETTLPDVLTARLDFCPICVGGGSFPASDETSSSSAPEAAPSLPEIIEEMIAETDDEDPFLGHLCNFREELPGLPAKLREKFRRLAALDGPEPKLKLVIERKREEWESMLDTVLGTSAGEKTVESVTERAIGCVGRIADGVGKRLDSESGEMHRTIRGVGKALRNSNDALDASWEEEERKRDAKRLLRNSQAYRPGRRLKRFTLVVITLGIVGWSAYGLIGLL